MALLGCAGDEPSGKVAVVAGFAGLVAADEPRAALVGRDVLGNGGTAADAAVAMAFAMGVTLPSRAGLGSRGVCVTYKGEAREGLALPFFADGDGPILTMPRAMALLHARYGNLPWEYLVAPAEQLARFGHVVSRALAVDIAALGRSPDTGPELEAILTSRHSKPLQLGDKLTQSELSAVLTGIRSQGAGYVYSSHFAARFADAATAAAAPVSVEALRGYRVEQVAAAEAPIGLHIAYFAPAPSGGERAARLWTELVEERGYDDLAAPARAELMLDIAAQVLGRQKEPDTPIASFIAGDRWGNAVACGMTLNGLFGRRRLAEGTGIILPSPSPAVDHQTRWMAPVIVANSNNGFLPLAAVASGGPAGIASLVDAMVAIAEDERPLPEVTVEPRFYHGDSLGWVVHEPSLEARIRDSLLRQGFRLTERLSLGRINIFSCPKGLREGKQSCVVAADPRFHGLAKVVQ